MAINKRTYPNNYFAWYNDDKRVAILSLDTSVSSGERTKEAYDTWQGNGTLSGNITATSTSSTVVITSAAHGLVTGDRVTISGTTTYDGNRTVTLVTVDSFSITDSNSTDNEGAVSGVTWVSLFVKNGLRLTYHSKYETVTTNHLDAEISTTHGLDTGMQNALLCYIKARLYDDQGDIQKAQYFRQMYEKSIKNYPSRKSGVRQLSVPRL
tara:strand:+ start:783 stop:1412 length:630 start_codon:yes stop_codon:yes gene_type:complete